jgi:Flp pilus assembly protein TadD
MEAQRMATGRPEGVEQMLEQARALGEQGRADEAIALLRLALSREPGHAECWYQLGNALLKQGSPAEAAEAYRSAVRLVPRSADAHNNLGIALKAQGLADEAVACFRLALELEPGHARTQFNLGATLMSQGRLEEARNALQRAVQLSPDEDRAHGLLAYVSLWQGRRAEAYSAFRACAELRQNHGRPVSSRAVSVARARHEAEQARHLAARRLLGDGHADYLDALARLEKRAPPDADASARMSLSEAERQALAPAFNRILHWPDCPALPGAAVNPRLDAGAIEARYRERQPEIMYVDELLTAPALQSLRRFCLEATIWKRDYQGGYLGAMMGDGFASPLLIQIAEELRGRFPGVFGAHRLTQAWAFKYDSISQGLKIHADTAAVNVNFWITPDDANLDPEGGGLVVWDREPPAEWDFSLYNNESMEPAVMAFLENAGASPVKIPYRQNRAVIFNSNLFHCTDSFNFRDEYECRRVNVTLLYGNRPRGADISAKR